VVIHPAGERAEIQVLSNSPFGDELASELHDLPAMSTTSQNRRKDRHRSPFMIRLPEVFRTKLAQYADRSGQTMTALVKLALKQFLARAGLWSKQDDARLAAQEPVPRQP
jgi:hypothetical protein